ncbi:MAG: hypothetical protein IKN66_07160 [Ruminococcus sp.]|nr:hypothetical protein [Ruminococcus sp.]
MFGYVRAHKPLLRVCEYEGYRSVYCGVCKAISHNFGELPRLSLSYDLAFLALMDMGVNNVLLKAEMQRCIVHPVTKRNCAVCTEGLDYSSYAAIILLYHKLKDDLADDKGIASIAAKAFLPALNSAYRKARKKYPRLAAVVEKQTRAQIVLEKENCTSLDRACEPTARIMRAVFSELSSDPSQKKQLGAFGYYLGRYIYLTDALDDLREDHRKGCYNPLLLYYKCDKLDSKSFTSIADNTAMSVFMTLGQLAEAYCRIDIKLYKSILDNVVYLGLGNVFDQVRKETFRKKKKERNSLL